MRQHCSARELEHLGKALFGFSRAAPMTRRDVVLAFILGSVIGFFLGGGGIQTFAFPRTAAPFHISTVPITGVSHNPEIKKQVLASYLKLPHITQVAKSSLKVGQVAAENWHKDMAELFFFVQGEGVLNLDGVNHSIRAGSISLVFPPTKHTIYNTGSQESLDLISVASTP